MIPFAENRLRAYCKHHMSVAVLCVRLGQDNMAHCGALWCAPIQLIDLLAFEWHENMPVFGLFKFIMSSGSTASLWFAHLESRLIAAWRAFHQRALDLDRRFSHVCPCVLCLCLMLHRISRIFHPVVAAEGDRSLSSSPAVCTVSSLSVSISHTHTHSKGLLSSAHLCLWTQVWGQQVLQIWLRALLIWQNCSCTN